MSSLEPDGQCPISTINMSKEVMSHKLKIACRLCLNERRSQVSLYKRTAKKTNLTNADIVHLFTDILLDPQDGLPGMICTKCENMLHMILIFKSECQESNETLMNLFRTLTLQEMKVEEGDFETKPGFDEVIENLGFDEVFETSVVDHDYANLQASDILQHIQKPKKGPKCSKMVQGPAKSMEHMAAHERKEQKALMSSKPLGEDPLAPKTLFKCDVCKKEFTLKHRLQQHIDTHLPMSIQEDVFVCHCGKKYIDSGALRIHQLTVHTSNVPMYTCEICNKEFKNNQDYNQHVHTSKKHYACDMCSYKSEKRYNMRRHMLKHNDQYDFQCGKCSKKFKHKTSLTSHLKTHECKVGCLKGGFC